MPEGPQAESRLVEIRRAAITGGPSPALLWRGVGVLRTVEWSCEGPNLG
ncbi:MAG: hypothetical protein XD74_1687 [Actinobacteria bacterium 66_15]|jgi:hypothetical protein|nr:MAG: hypothetical protein XD74_1687 [Actinobacteria bacterium 66_15]